MKKRYSGHIHRIPCRDQTGSDVVGWLASLGVKIIRKTGNGFFILCHLPFGWSWSRQSLNDFTQIAVRNEGGKELFHIVEAKHGTACTIPCTE